MRVQLNRRAARDERGVVAVVVGLLAVVLLGIGAFSIDLGMAYASTRQLQTASDAAALAAANVFKKSPGTSCTAILTAGVAAGAEGVADTIRLDNRPLSTRTAYSAACDVNGNIVVTYSSQGTSPRFFGPLLGRNTDYTSERTAVAKVQALTDGVGLRPYALCGSQIPAAAGTVFKMNLPTTGTTVCPGAASPGNWWTVDCPESIGNNSNAVLADKTLNGCSSPLSIVPGQVTNPARTPNGLRTYLESYCAGGASQSCLSANPGGIGGSQVLNAWTTLASEQRRITFPVFCGVVPNGPCDQAAVINAGGNNAVYPIQSILGAQVCGWRFGNDEYPPKTVPLSGECGGANNPLGLSTNDPNPVSQVNYLLLRQVDVPALGTSGPGSCPLGSPCDKARVAVLIQ